MPIKHSLVGMLHEQGRLGRALVKGDVVGAEGMPQDVTELAQPSLVEGLLLLPIVNRAADLPFMALGSAALIHAHRFSGRTLQNLALA